MRYGGSIRAYHAEAHELADLLADVDSEDLLVYMPHQNDEALHEAKLGQARAQETLWEN